MFTAGCPPLVFKHTVDQWPAQQWTPEYLSQVLGDKLLDCKISLIQHEDFQWEPDCLHLKIRMRQYVDWLQSDMENDNPLRLFDKTKFSCYIDYKYMKNMFEEQPHMLKAVSWDAFGLDGCDGEHSTIWMGSEGTYTPCHQDTYGFNLVAQIQGRKRWYLFNPDQTEFMYPTRIPYEESSIYSEVNVRYPNLRRHPLFQKTTPFVIELAPGDVLYVPRHWWHFVESLEPSISINTWVPMVEDAQSHLEESVSRLLYTCLSTTLLNKAERSSYLNTGEELEKTEVNLKYIQTAVKDLLNSELTQGRNDKDLKKRESLSVGQKQGHTDAERLSVEQFCDNLQKFSNKFQNAIVTVDCLCGVDMDKTGQHIGTHVRKRKGLRDDENESIEEHTTDILFEMRNKHRKTESDVEVNVGHEVEVDKDVAALPDVRDEPYTPCSQHCDKVDQAEDSCKSNESVVRIYAAKPFTFTEYLRFIKIVFDYEMEKGHNNCIESTIGNSIQLPLAEKSATSVSSSVVQSLRSSSDMKTLPLSGASSLSSSSSRTTRSVPEVSKAATTPVTLFSTETNNNPPFGFSVCEPVNRETGDAKLIQKVEKEEQGTVLVINDESDQTMSDMSDDELRSDDTFTVNSVDIINSILHPSVIKRIGHILMNKGKK